MFSFLFEDGIEFTLEELFMDAKIVSTNILAIFQSFIKDEMFVTFAPFTLEFTKDNKT